MELVELSANTRIRVTEAVAAVIPGIPSRRFKAEKLLTVAVAPRSSIHVVAVAVAVAMFIVLLWFAMRLSLSSFLFPYMCSLDNTHHFGSISSCSLTPYPS